VSSRVFHQSGGGECVECAEEAALEKEKEKGVLVERPRREARRRRRLALAELFVPVDVEHVGNWAEEASRIV